MTYGTPPVVPDFEDPETLPPGPIAPPDDDLDDDIDDDE